MRVTNAAVYKKFTTSANDVHARLIKSFNKVSSGAAYESAAESPLSYYESKKIDYRYQEILSKQSLLTDVQSRLYQQELGARDIQSTLSKAKNQVQYARTATTTGTAMQSLGDDLLQKQHEIVNSLNGQYENFYIYGGNDISHTPFSLSADGTMFTYSHTFPGEDKITTFNFKLSDTGNGEYEFVLSDADGNELKDADLEDAKKGIVKAMQEQGRIDIDYGTIRDRSTLLDTYTGGLNVLTGLTSDSMKAMATNKTETEIYDEIIKPRMDKSPLALIGQAVQTISNYTKEEGADGKIDAETMNRVLGETIEDMTSTEHELSAVYSDLGNKYRLLTDMDTRLNREADSLTERYTNTWGADPYEAIMEMYNSQYAYNAALQVGSNLMGSSLFDFMR